LLNYKAESKSCPKFISKKHGNKARWMMLTIQ
jgi:hypothetical protein